MSFRSWLSIVTIVFLGLIVFFARHEIFKAWDLLGSVNLWILALLVPIQIISYIIGGEMMFSYLRQKGATKDISPLSQGRMALEMNFVNHTLPSAGVSGISYMTWLLGNFGISAGRATAAQLVRFVMTFAAFITLLLLAVAVIILDGTVSRGAILLSTMIVLAMVTGTAAMAYLLAGKTRAERFGLKMTKLINGFVRRISFGRRKSVLKEKAVIEFFHEMHDEYITLRKDGKILIKPYLWGLAFIIVDVALFLITFWALGHPVNPAPVLIAYGLAAFAGFIVITPGGAGAYEAIMVSFLATAGIPAGVAIAGILLTRVIMLLGTIIFGYIFYQHSIIKYGKSKPTI